MSELTITCQAWILAEPGGIIHRCVLKAGHYRGDTLTGHTPVSWHTDCPDAKDGDSPVSDQYKHDHPGTVPCLVWADHAQGAHPDDSATVGSMGEIAEPARTLTDLGGYRAEISIGDITMSVYGPAKFVANVVRTFADAFEEEAER